MKTLIIANNLRVIVPQEDSSLYLLRACLKKDLQCYWGDGDRVFWDGFGISVWVQEVQEAEPLELPILKSEVKSPLEDFDLVFIRKNPPFNEGYLKLCWLTAAYEGKIRISNKPSLLARYHEKILQLEALARGYLDQNDIISTGIPETIEDAVSYVQSLTEDQIVIKPWLGFGGREISLVSKKNFLSEPAKWLSSNKRWIIQPFDQRVEEQGDRRVMFIGGRYAGDFIRMPQKGNFISNLAQGGEAQSKELNEKERTVISKLEKFLSLLGIEFAGADFIAGRVNEVNITSPTGLASFERLYQKDLAPQIVEEALKQKVI